MTHSLTLGLLSLTDDLPDVDHGYVLSVLADGAGFGVAQGVQEVVQSLLADGDLVRVTRYGNRTVSFRVKITGPTLDAVARGEAALRSEVGRPNLLIWQAPDTFAEPTAFEVITSEMAQVFDDLDELKSARTFTVTLTCAPFARETDLTVIDAPAPPSPTPVTEAVISGATPAGWSATVADYKISSTVSPTGVVDKGSYVEAVGEGYWVQLTLSASFASAPMSSTRYLVFDYYGSPSPAFAVVTPTGNVTVRPAMTRAVGGATRYALDCAGIASITGLRVQHSIKSDTYRAVSAGMGDVTRTDTLPQVTGRQSTRIIDVGGTERTSGSLRVSASNPLRLTLVATWPETGSGFSPPLRRWRVGGNTPVPTADTYSGSVEPIGPSFVQHDIAATSLPVGTYQLMGLLRATSAGSYPLESVIQSRMNGATLGEAPLWSETVAFPLANDWRLVPMGIYRIPIVSANAGEFRISIRCTSSNNVQYDELWLFPVDEDCALTALVAAERNVWLDSPSLETRVPKFYEGTAADRTDAHWPINGVFAPGLHTFKPGRMAVFTASGEANPAVSLSYFRRFHSNVSREA